MKVFRKWGLSLVCATHVYWDDDDDDDRSSWLTSSFHLHKFRYWNHRNVSVFSVCVCVCVTPNQFNSLWFLGSFWCSATCMTQTKVTINHKLETTQKQTKPEFQTFKPNKVQSFCWTEWLLTQWNNQTQREAVIAMSVCLSTYLRCDLFE